MPQGERTPVWLTSLRHSFNRFRFWRMKCWGNSPYIVYRRAINHLLILVQMRSPLFFCNIGANKKHNHLVSLMCILFRPLTTKWEWKHWLGVGAQPGKNLRNLKRRVMQFLFVYFKPKNVQTKVSAQ